MMAQSPRSAWIYARNDRPGRPWKQQYSVSRSCTEATLKAKAQNLPKQNTSREIPAPADKQSIERDLDFISIFFSISLFYERIRKKAER
ncbi:hypothetical protein V6N12_020279 [Hibiscus sabdariffa]|uniref:Uncharacterized protein n=1 Tax=Hibiscus sabdariffa TaxID=183260 RepID=A0ABR2BUD3_9ROSI